MTATAAAAVTAQEALNKQSAELIGSRGVAIAGDGDPAHRDTGDRDPTGAVAADR
jgi:hypothetical protein